MHACESSVNNLWFHYIVFLTKDFIYAKKEDMVLIEFDPMFVEKDFRKPQSLTMHRKIDCKIIL